MKIDLNNLKCKRLEGKSAIVIGGASGIGRACCFRFAAEGAQVMVCDYNEAGAKEVAAEIGENALYCSVNVLDEGSVINAYAYALRVFGRIDVSVGAVGGGPISFVLTTTAEKIDAACELNLKGNYFCLREAAKIMKELGNGGSIITIASTNAIQPAEGMWLYCANKAAEAMMTKCAALELGKYNIRVNAIGPGLTDTPLTANAGQTTVPEIRQKFMDNTPLGRVADPSEQAALAAWLASDDGAYATGQTFYNDGGVTLKAYPTGIMEDDTTIQK